VSATLTAGYGRVGLAEHEATIDYLVDLIIEVQTVRSCQTAAELDPERSVRGYAIPNRAHVGAGSVAMLKARQRMAEVLRTLPGSSIVVAPADTDLAAAEVGAGLAESFEGGRYTALQRAALLQLAADHVVSSLDGRESAFELHANGGIPAWRGRLRRFFADYNVLANGVLRALSVEMPAIDLTSIREIPLAPRRPVAGPGPGR
jgi:4-hydroxyphenylacetate 3-monooxygenase